MNRKWWKETVVYQIYPRSFYDSNGDGIGDLRGIIKKINYLCELGVGVIWLSPIFTSPNEDMGYDISDYHGIANEFGTLKDFDELVTRLHKSGIKLILDLVVNHSSDEHPWFIESRSSKKNSKRDYYIWRDGKNGKEPNNWASFFNSSVWEYDKLTNQYYLHLFSKKQPDLNWQNENVRKEIYDIMNWWLDRGIDGFRLDTITLIDKKDGLPDSKKEASVSEYVFDNTMFANRPRVHIYLKEMYKKVFEGKDIMVVGEAPFVNANTASEYVNEDKKKLNMIIDFDMMDIDSGTAGKWEIVNYDLLKLKKIITRWQTSLPNGWNSLYWSNHDQPRVVSRFGEDKKYHKRSAKMLAILLHMLRGTPFIYQGEEIGMTNMPFKSVKDLRDIESLKFYNERINMSKSKNDAWNSILKKGRDNSRTPLQWNNSRNAGFTSGKPWIKINPNYKNINIDVNLKDKDSIFNFYRRIIKMRKDNPIMVYGSYKPLLEKNKNIIAYLREYNNIKWLIIINFYNSEIETKLPPNYIIKDELISNILEKARIKSNIITLAPYEARVFIVE
ncbi:MAG: alpha-glucosidase [Actinomycetota bacterium]